MSRPNFDVKETKIGDGTLDEYTFSFKITNQNHLLVVHLDAAGAVVFVARGSDTMFLQNVTFDPLNGGGRVYLEENLESGHKLILLLADDEPTQPTRFRDQGDFTLRKLEQALDVQGGQIQRLAYLISRTMGFDDTVDVENVSLKVTRAPEDRSLPIWTETFGVIWVSIESLTGGTGAQVPVGGEEGSVLTKLSDDDGDTEWKSFGYQGYSARFGVNWESTNLDDTLRKILNLSYAGPLVNLNASGVGVREKGVEVTSVTLTATTTKRSNPIAQVRFFKDGVQIYNVPSPIANGGVESYTWNGSFDDTTTFSVEVTDTSVDGDGPTTASASQTFTYVYPYYVGAGAPGLSAAAVAGLTKRVITSTATRTETITAANGNVLYFAYPASYGALISILDVNNFETFPDWTLRTENITGLDGNAVSYRIYEFENPLVAQNYTYTFKR